MMATTGDDAAFAAWSRERQQRIEAVLDSILTQADAGARARLLSAMRYSTLGGGKRMRPLLAYAAAELTGGSPNDADASAAAVELIHAYSLIHDDLPCMDDDALRRGKPTCHVAFDVATALLAGDALQSIAFEVLGRARGGGEACATLAAAAGYAGMAGGQQLDLDATGASIDIAALTRLHAMKTGALIHAAVMLGARCGRPLDAAETQALDRYARSAGLAFQVIDDVLDVEGSAATLGKTAGKDAAQNKATFVTLLGLADARARARALHDEAISALAPFGPAATRLIELANWIALRTS